MKRRFFVGGVTLLLSFAVTVTVTSLTSCSTVERTQVEPPAIEGATFVGNNVCADCHGNITGSFPSSVHARFYQDDPQWAGKTGCESCHGAGSKHVAAGGGLGKFIINPGKDPTVCFGCHLETEAEFNLPHHHPVTEGRMNCVQCHDPHGRDILKPAAGLAMARVNDSSAQCHRDRSRPFVFEHEALREGCTVCHSPHGSISAQLLHQRDNNLCLRCHAQVHIEPASLVMGKFSHSSFVRGRTCWSAGCHPAVHGSNFFTVVPSVIERELPAPSEPERLQSQRRYLAGTIGSLLRN